MRDRDAILCDTFVFDKLLPDFVEDLGHGGCRHGDELDGGKREAGRETVEPEVQM